MDPTKVDKKLVLLALAVLGPKVKQWSGYELTVDDIYSLITAGVVIQHAVDVWRAKLDARPTQLPPNPIGGYTPATSIADPASPPRAP